MHFPLTEQFRYDVVFNDDGSEIIASRFIIQTKNILDANMEKEMLISLRELAQTFPFSVVIYHHYFIFFDQFVLVRSISIQTITVAAIVMMAISLIFIPSASCALWVAFSIISIEIGVIGYMTLWNVNLDSISMINLIMCIGFSVDFSAHISYAYNSSEKSTPGERVREALYMLGLPIFQGSVSTVLGIIALAFAPSYVFVTFFKTVFLVMLFGATHGLFLLPVLLSLTDICRTPIKVKDDALTTNLNQSGHLKYKPERQMQSYMVSNIQEAHNKDIDFFTTDKYFNGKTIVSKDRPPIYIPRPLFKGIGPGSGDEVVKMCGSKQQKSSNDEVGSVEGSKSLSTSNSSSLVAEKDMGLGTSAEECSESSWKGGDKNENEEEVIVSESQIKRDKVMGKSIVGERWSGLSSSRVNAGYISDSGDTDNEIPTNDDRMMSIIKGQQIGKQHYNNKHSKALTRMDSDFCVIQYKQNKHNQQEKPKRRYSHSNQQHKQQQQQLQQQLMPNLSQFRIGNIRPHHHHHNANELNYYHNWNTSWLDETQPAANTSKNGSGHHFP